MALDIERRIVTPQRGGNAPGTVQPSPARIRIAGDAESSEHPSIGILRNLTARANGRFALVSGAPGNVNALHNVSRDTRSDDAEAAQAVRNAEGTSNYGQAVRQYGDYLRARTNLHRHVRDVLPVIAKSDRPQAKAIVQNLVDGDKELKKVNSGIDKNSLSADDQKDFNSAAGDFDASIAELMIASNKENLGVDFSGLGSSGRGDDSIAGGGGADTGFADWFRGMVADTRDRLSHLGSNNVDGDKAVDKKKEEAREEEIAKAKQLKTKLEDKLARIKAMIRNGANPSIEIEEAGRLIAQAGSINIGVLPPETAEAFNNSIDGANKDLAEIDKKLHPTTFAFA